MSIQKPDRALLRHLPLRFVRARAGGRGRAPVDASIPLVPFIDFLIVLVVFLLSSFGSGEIAAARPNLVVPTAIHGRDLELSPIITIDERSLTLDGRRMADTATIAATVGVERIEPLVQDLRTLERNWSVLHPTEPFPGTVVIQADRATDFRVIKSVMFSAAQAGYTNLSFAVNHAGE